MGSRYASCRSVGGSIGAFGLETILPDHGGGVRRPAPVLRRSSDRADRDDRCEFAPCAAAGQLHPQPRPADGHQRPGVAQPLRLPELAQPIRAADRQRTEAGGRRHPREGASGALAGGRPRPRGRRRDPRRPASLPHQRQARRRAQPGPLSPEISKVSQRKVPKIFNPKNEGCSYQHFARTTINNSCVP